MVYERRLEIGQTVSAIVEKVGNTPVVSLEGLPKLKLLEDLVEGETVDGVVARKTGAGVIFDIGCESFGLLRRDKQRDVFKLEPNESVKGLRIDRIDINKSRIDVSLAGLSDLVAGRPEIERDVDKKDTPAAPTKAKPKKETAEPEKEAGAAKKKNNMNKEEATQGATQSVVLDGADLLPSMKGGSVTLELTGGLAIESVDMARGIITLTRDAAAAATKKKKKKQKKKKKVNASIAAAGEEKDEEDGPGGLLF
ncbi:unnamed protein product [Prorocentrum cordatum]|uniref:S1 motif domain-containing protein n=1 Tax=Prorocentrum cordatum TaxID=2364126 RepID=A0ABN9WT05_9DINO|nr:unnamed protein product [Polarella glacialis]